MGFFPIKVKSFEHIVKMFDLADKVELRAVCPIGNLTRVMTKDEVMECKTGIVNSLKEFPIYIEGVKQ